MVFRRAADEFMAAIEFANQSGLAETGNRSPGRPAVEVVDSA